MNNIFGTSFLAGKTEVGFTLNRYLKPKDKICDMGPGSGSYRNLLGSSYEWTGVEIWHPTIEFLANKYDHLYEMDVRDFTWPEDYKLVIFGDILEHLPLEDAQKLVKRAKHHAQMIMIAVPYNSEQDMEYGNPAERHIQTDLNPLNFIERYPGFVPIFTGIKDGIWRYEYWLWLKDFLDE